MVGATPFYQAIMTLSKATGLQLVFVLILLFVSFLVFYWGCLENFVSVQSKTVIKAIITSFQFYTVENKTLTLAHHKQTVIELN